MVEGAALKETPGCTELKETKQDTEHGMSQNQVTKPVTKHSVKITTKVTVQ